MPSEVTMTIQKRIVELLEKEIDDKSQSLWRVCNGTYNSALSELVSKKVDEEV